MLWVRSHCKRVAWRLAGKEEHCGNEILTENKKLTQASSPKHNHTNRPPGNFSCIGSNFIPSKHLLPRSATRFQSIRPFFPLLLGSTECLDEQPQFSVSKTVLRTQLRTVASQIRNRMLNTIKRSLVTSSQTYKLFFYICSPARYTKCFNE